MSNTIAQLGGNRFLAMTGAKDLVNTSNKANKVVVTLTAADLYDVRFLTIRRVRWNDVLGPHHGELK